MAQVKSLRTGIKYKETPIGKIPVDWEVTSLNDLASSERNAVVDGPFGSNLKLKDYVEEGIPVLQGKNITSNCLNWFDIRYVSEAKGNELSRSFARIGDILMTKIGTLGCAAIIDDLYGHEHALIPANLLKISPDSTKIDTQFLYQMLIWNSTKKRILDKASRTAQPALSLKTVRSFQVSRPPLAEQKKIVEILLAADDSREEIDKIIEKSKELKKGLMQKLLTRGIGHKKFKKTKIGKIPSEWDVVNLKKVAAVRYGLGQPPALDADGIPMVRATNIHNGEIIDAGVIRVKKEAIPRSRNPYLKEDDIIVVRSGAYTGDIGLITKKWERAVAGYDLVVSPSKKVNSLFLTNYLLSSHVQKGYFALLKERSAQPHLNSAQVEETPIALPPLSEQHRIADILNFADMEIKKEQEQRTRLESLKKSLMQVLLTGKVRVQLRQ